MSSDKSSLKNLQFEIEFLCNFIFLFYYDTISFRHIEVEWKIDNRLVFLFEQSNKIMMNIGKNF